MALTDKEKKDLRTFIDLVFKQICESVSPQVAIQIFEYVIDFSYPTPVFAIKIQGIIESNKTAIKNTKTTMILIQQLAMVRAEMAVDSDRARSSREVLIEYSSKRVRELKGYLERVAGKVVTQEQSGGELSKERIAEKVERERRAEKIQQDITEIDAKIVSEVSLNTAIDIFMSLTNLEISHLQFHESVAISLSKDPPIHGMESIQSALEAMDHLRTAMENGTSESHNIKGRVYDYFSERIDHLIEDQATKEYETLKAQSSQGKKEKEEFERMKRELLQEDHERKLEERREKRLKEQERQKKLHEELQSKHDQMIEERKGVKEEREEEKQLMQRVLQEKYEKELQERKAEKEQGKIQMHLMQEERQRRHEKEVEERRYEKEQEKVQMEKVREDKQQEYEERHKKFEQEKVFLKLKAKADALKKKLLQEQQYQQRQSKKQSEEAKRRERVILLQQERRRQERARQLPNSSESSGNGDKEPIS
ncbi:MAG: hypothetical protein K0R63_1827 [Rickettsiales bacterium]|jgi:hypothetical protein|nr:hypothetical protein [Rickettsiales bacterium]